MDDIQTVDKRKRIIFLMSGNEYDIPVFISFNDICSFENVIDSDEPDYKKAFCQMIWNKIPGDKVRELSFEEVVELVEADKEYFINCFLELNNDYNFEYEKLFEEPNSYKRFIESVVNSNKKRLNGLFDSISQMDFSSFLADFEKVRTSILETTEMIANYIFPLAEKLSDAIANLRIPKYTEEEKKEIESSYIHWGEYGWTIMLESPIGFFDKCPTSLKDANSLALKYCNKDAMQNLFFEMRQEKKIKHSDLEEAIFCYENKKWKSCAMILLALIESDLIHMQSRTPINQYVGTKNKRKTGASAVKIIRKWANDDTDLEQQFLMYCVMQNILSCCDKVFEYGNDFKEQPTIINRNFLFHGMLVKPVRRMDCIQLFLLYYNLITFMR